MGTVGPTMLTVKFPVLVRCTSGEVLTPPMYAISVHK